MPETVRSDPAGAVDIPAALVAPAPPDVEPAADDLGVLSGPPAATSARGRGGPLAWVKILGGVLGGPVLLYVALGVLADATAELRIAMALAGAALMFLGLDTALKRRWPGVKTGIWVAVAWIGLVAVASASADLLPLAESRDASNTFQEPILATPDLFSEHPLGTDRQGLDILGGILYGFRVSLVIGLGTVTIGVVVGGLIGMMAGYHRQHVDRIVSFFTNSMLAFPPLILLLGVAAVMDRNVRNMTFALALVTIPIYIRLARANTLVVCQREFVLAARSLGAKSRHIILRDIAPSVIRPMLSYAFVVIAVIIVAEASLSFLGLGIPRPEPTLGNLISAGQRDFDRYPHLVFGPAAALFVTVLALNRLGEEAQRRLSGRETQL